jgi:hypothetical protein
MCRAGVNTAIKGSRQELNLDHIEFLKNLHKIDVGGLACR